MVERPLRILQVSRMDIAGGAEKVAWNLLQGYCAQGHNSWLAVGQKFSQNPNVFTIDHYKSGSFWSRFWWYIQAYLQSLVKQKPEILFFDRLARVLAHPAKLIDAYRGVEDFYFPGSWNLLKLSPLKPDIIHCHNLHHNYFDLRVLSWLSHQVPVVLTLHDAWLLSGHCAHSFDCERWKTGCGYCPDLTLHPAIRRDATAYNWQRKQEIYKKSRLYVSTPSQWLMRKVEQSILAPAVIEKRIIPYGVDLSTFCPADQQIVRAKLGLSLEAKVLLFTANGIRQNIWKDYHMMRSAIALIAERLPEQRMVFVALGEDGPVEHIGQAEVQFVPYQKDPDIVANYYQAADIYLHAARVDTFPNTVLEALACGTPVVATAVGGIPEQLDDGKTGFLVPPGDSQAMAAAIQQLLQCPDLHVAVKQAAALEAKYRFRLENEVNSYLEWYQEILEDWRQNQELRIKL